MRYGKLKNGNLIRPPRNKITGNETIINYNLHEDFLIRDGFLPIIENKPVEKEGFFYIPKYKEKNGKIFQSWGYVKITEDFLDSNINAE